MLIMGRYLSQYCASLHQKVLFDSLLANPTCPNFGMSWPRWQQKLPELPGTCQKLPDGCRPG